MRQGQISMVLAVLVLGTAGCDDVNGGAVELSWRFRPEPGLIPDNPCDPFVCCDSQQPGTTPIDRVELTWSVDGEGSSASWECSAGNGVTHFDVPAGDVLLSVAPLCDGYDPDPTTYIAPAPAQRTVTVGNTVSLGAVELLLRVSSCETQPCICAPVAM